MSYGTRNLVKMFLANALMSKTPESGSQLIDYISIGNTLDTNLVTLPIIDTYLNDADQTINRTIAGMYGTPLRKVSDPELRLLADVSGSDTVVLSSESGVLAPGDALLFVDGDAREEAEISAIASGVVTLTASLAGVYESASTRVLRIDYPYGVKYIAARLAAANIYDKYFAAQADKNESQFGKHLRELAYAELEKILLGITPLPNQLREGHLTVNPNLFKPHQFPKGWNESPPKLPRPGQG